MRHALQWIRSIIFNVQMYVSMIVIALAFTPLVMLDRKWALVWMQVFGRWVRFTARWIVGLKTEVRGEVPTGAVLIASKHQSFLDSITLVSVLPAARFIMKKELGWIPLMGWHALRAGFIPVDRGKRGAAIKKMMADVAKGREQPGQLIIYPQGTRVAPGDEKPYKMGTAVLYGQLEQDCHPVATNVGVFWPRHGVFRKPGTAVIEFLPPIAPGHTPATFMVELESAIETASNRLIAEARGA
ncbi:lysophospholipid acyltransferase family protein [Cereibacter sphaeroides]|uniref:lysophospholipid acyltransferase family protein n=1 Tax=Cereibacter sphaeroides TaxID=1063 RepID=UPI001F36FB2B|nr:lysophospholipid acyltransferase family protein [Cereibacter sphaeroides]MCE6950493.1 1-acyl-sn-glycerol-3-phosphate acyltransferase [Cereibacter sphaeroides]MCE6968253.1 1-acyl-sn-glycerol-3-phosphate acyltransferase [Cereibacter sphaeroides]